MASGWGEPRIKEKLAELEQQILALLKTKAEAFEERDWQWSLKLGLLRHHAHYRLLAVTKLLNAVNEAADAHVAKELPNAERAVKSLQRLVTWQPAPLLFVEPGLGLREGVMLLIDELECHYP